MNEISIVVPCPQSAAVLPPFFDALAEHLMANPSDVDVIVVMSDQSEHPVEILDDVRSRYPWLQLHLLQRVGVAGRFGALARFGIAYSTSRYIVLVSPYGEDDLHAMNAMLREVRQGAQIAQATRYATPEDSLIVPLRFRAYQYVYRRMVRLLLGQELTDTTYGFKMFDRVFVQALGLTQNGYSVCPEITLKGLLANGRVVHVPTTPQQPHAVSDFRLLREGLGYLWLLGRGTAHRIGVPWF
jgi:hypothetical protein